MTLFIATIHPDTPTPSLYLELVATVANNVHIHYSTLSGVVRCKTGHVRPWKNDSLSNTLELM